MYPEVSGSSRGSCFRQYSGAMLGFSKDQTRMTNRNRKGVVGMLPNANFQCSVTLPSKFQRFGDTSWGDWWRIWNASTVWVMGRHIPNQTWNTSVATCRGHEQWLSNQQFGTCSGFFTPSNTSSQTHNTQMNIFGYKGCYFSGHLPAPEASKQGWRTSQPRATRFWATTISVHVSATCTHKCSIPAIQGWRAHLAIYPPDTWFRDSLSEAWGHVIIWRERPMPMPLACCQQISNLRSFSNL